MTTSPPERDWDAEFTQITAQLDDPPAPPPNPGLPQQWRAPETGPVVAGVASDPHPQTASRAVSDPGRSIQLDEINTFEPPTPQPLNADDPATTIMIGSLIVGPLWLLYLTVFNRQAATLWWDPGRAPPRPGSRSGRRPPTTLPQ